MKTTPSNQDQPHSRQRAFTRTDLVVTIGTTALMAGLACSTLGGMRPAAESAVCANNLRQTGQAFRAWAADRNNRFPWQTAQTEGGTMFSPATWTSFQALSDEVSSPRVFVCPSDTQRNHPLDFGSGITGLAHIMHRNNAISYFFSLDTFADHPSQFLLGDRHLDGGTPNTGCRFVNVNVAYTVTREQALQGRIRWTNSLHGPHLGNIAMNDGSAISATTRTLQEVVIQMEPDGNYNHHLMFP
jgi:hypothetical protein